jgi:hypothetical protein
MDGSALSQHMEDFYLLTLREALLTIRPDLADDLEAALEEIKKDEEEAAAAAAAKRA